MEAERHGILLSSSSISSFAFMPLHHHHHHTHIVFFISSSYPSPLALQFHLVLDLCLWTIVRYAIEVGPEGLGMRALIVVLPQKCLLHPMRGLNSRKINTAFMCTSQKHYRGLPLTCSSHRSKLKHIKVLTGCCCPYVMKPASLLTDGISATETKKCQSSVAPRIADKLLHKL